MKKCFIQWWILILGFAAAFFWAAYFGAIQAIVTTDVTHISSITFFVCVILSLFLGWNSYRLDYDNVDEVERSGEIGWFGADVCMSLGLLGTVIGFIMMMTTQLAGANPADPGSMMLLVSKISMSLGTALYTTAVGIASGIVLKIQSYNLQRSVEKLRHDD